MKPNAAADTIMSPIRCTVQVGFKSKLCSKMCHCTDQIHTQTPTQTHSPTHSLSHIHRERERVKSIKKTITPFGCTCSFRGV